MQINVVFEYDDHYTDDDKIQLWRDICFLLEGDGCDLRLTFSDVCSDLRK